MASPGQQSNLWSDTMSYLADVWKRHLNINLKVRPLMPAIHIPLRDKGDYEITFEGSAQALGTGAIDFLNFFVSGRLMNYQQMVKQRI